MPIDYSMKRSTAILIKGCLFLGGTPSTSFLTTTPPIQTNSGEAEYTLTPNKQLLATQTERQARSALCARLAPRRSRWPAAAGQPCPRPPRPAPQAWLAAVGNPSEPGPGDGGKEDTARMGSQGLAFLGEHWP